MDFSFFWGDFSSFMLWPSSLLIGWRVCVWRGKRPSYSVRIYLLGWDPPPKKWWWRKRRMESFEKRSRFMSEWAFILSTHFSRFSLVFPFHHRRTTTFPPSHLIFLHLLLLGSTHNSLLSTQRLFFFVLSISNSWWWLNIRLMSWPFISSSSRSSSARSCRVSGSKSEILLV